MKARRFGIVLTSPVLAILLLTGGFRRFAGSQVPPDTIAYFERSFHRDKPEDLCNITGCKQRASHRYISKSKHTIRRELSNNAGTQSEGEVSAQGGGRGIVEHSFLGRESQSEEVAHYAEPFEQIVQSSLQENTVANLLARARVQQSAATSVSSVREGDLQSAVEMLLLRARAASSFQQPNPTRIELSANRAGSGFGPLELHNLLSGSSYHSMLPVRIGRSDLMPAEVALFSSRLGFTVPGDNASEAAILACLLASQSTNFAAPLPTSTITGATTTRNLLESLLQGQRTSSAVAPVSLINLPPILSSLLGRRTGMNYSNADSATEGQLLQLYLMEQERQLRRQNQSGSERN